MRADEALERLGGISDRRSLTALVPVRGIRVALAEGTVVRLGRGRYALPAADEARIAAARLHGVVSHLSAALAHGWKVNRPPTQPTVTIVRTRSRVESEGVELHWGHLTPAELSNGVTSPLRTVVDCARSLPFAEALAVADSALRSGKVRGPALLATAAASPRTDPTTSGLCSPTWSGCDQENRQFVRPRPHRHARFEDEGRELPVAGLAATCSRGFHDARWRSLRSDLSALAWLGLLRGRARSR